MAPTRVCDPTGTRRWAWVLAFLAALCFGFGAATAAPSQPVHAASWSSSAYNSASVKGTWHALSSSGVAGTTGGSQFYLDSAGTLHFNASSNAASYSLTLGTTTGSALGDFKAQVKAISFEGAVSMTDKSRGFFQNFANLTTVTGLENVDVSRMTTMAYLFSSLISYSDNTTTTTNAKLTTLSGLDAWNVSNVTTMASMFAQQPLLTSVGDLSNWATGNVTDMHRMFYSDSALPSITFLTNWDVSKVTNFEYMFAYMDSVTRITGLENWNTGRVQNFGFMFAEDPKLASMAKLNWDTHSATTFTNLFADDVSLTSLDLSGWNVANANDFSMAFYNLTKLTSIKLTGWQPTAGTEFGNMFQNDKLLTSLPDIADWTMGNAANLTSMFEGMTSVTALPVAKWQLASNGQTNITNIFWGDNALTAIDVSGWTVKAKWAASDKVFPTYTYSSATLQSQLASITFGANWTGSVVLPAFLLSANTYGTWRGETYDKANVSGAGTKTELYTPPATAAARVETFRFAYDISATLVNSQGVAVSLAGVPIIVTDATGTEVMRAVTGATGAVTVPLNATTGTYTVTLGDLPDGYSATVDHATATIAGADASVTLVVDEQDDTDLVGQYPAAGGLATPLTVLAGLVLLLVGAAGWYWARRLGS